MKRLMVHGINAVAGDGAMALSPDQRTLALASSDRIVLAHPGTGTVEYVLPFPVPMIRVDNVSFSPNGKTLSAVATSIENKCGVYLWQAGTSDEAARPHVSQSPTSTELNPISDATQAK